jgi:hypothetical protein
MPSYLQTRTRKVRTGHFLTARALRSGGVFLGGPQENLPQFAADLRDAGQIYQISHHKHTKIDLFELSAELRRRTGGPAARSRIRARS